MSTLFDAVARRASRQHGRISHAQLLSIGVDRSRIKRWRADGRLRPVHRGVYAVGHLAPSALADLMAAVLACGDEARASHRSTLHARGVLKERPPKPEVSVPTAGGRRQPRIVVHRRATFAPGDTMTFEGIRMTSVRAGAARRRALARPGSALPGVPRGVGALSRVAAADRGLRRPQPGEARRREAAARVSLGRDPERPRARLPAPAARARPAAAAHEHRPQRRQGRLPLAARSVSRSSCSATASTRPAGRSRTTPPVAGGPVTSRSRGATSSSAAIRPSPSSRRCSPAPGASSARSSGRRGRARACVSFSGANVSHMTASSSVWVAPSEASTRPGCGPCGRPLGCSVSAPAPTPEREPNWPST